MAADASFVISMSPVGMNARPRIGRGGPVPPNAADLRMVDKALGQQPHEPRRDTREQVQQGHADEIRNAERHDTSSGLGHRQALGDAVHDVAVEPDGREACTASRGSCRTDRRTPAAAASSASRRRPGLGQRVDRRSGQRMAHGCGGIEVENCCGRNCSGPVHRICLGLCRARFGTVVRCGAQTPDMGGEHARDASPHQ